MFLSNRSTHDSDDCLKEFDVVLSEHNFNALIVRKDAPHFEMSATPKGDFDNTYYITGYNRSGSLSIS